MSERYLIWSMEHRGWWKGNRHGYTTRTDKAGQFSFEEAKAICENANRYDQPLSKQPKPWLGVNEIMVEAPSRDQIRLDLEYPDR
jgi:hypothetical protein